MKKSKLVYFSVALMMVASSVTMTGCGGSTKHKDSRISTGPLYQYTAYCKSGDVGTGHQNKITLTDSNGQPEKTTVEDFYVKIGDDSFRVASGTSASWSNCPCSRGTTNVNGLVWYPAGSTTGSSFNGKIYWTSLDLDGDTSYEGEATFTYG